MIAIWSMKVISVYSNSDLVTCWYKWSFTDIYVFWLSHTGNYYFIVTVSSSSIKSPKCVNVIIKTDNVMGVGPSLSEENEGAETLVRLDSICLNWAFLKVLIKSLCKALPNPCDATDFIIEDAFFFLPSEISFP